MTVGRVAQETAPRAARPTRLCASQLMTIGFDRFLRSAWLDRALQLAAAEMAPESAREQLEEALSSEVNGDRARTVIARFLLQTSPFCHLGYHTKSGCRVLGWVVTRSPFYTAPWLTTSPSLTPSPPISYASATAPPLPGVLCRLTPPSSSYASRVTLTWMATRLREGGSNA